MSEGSRSDLGPAPFAVGIEPGERFTTVHVEGEIDLGTVDDLHRTLGQADGDICLDLSEVTFLDSSGLRLLIDRHRALTERGNRFEILRPHPQVRRYLEIAGLADRLDIRD